MKWNSLPSYRRESETEKWPVRVTLQDQKIHWLTAQEKKWKVKELVAQSCLTLCDPMDCSLPGSSVRRILQARILEWVAIPFSRESSSPRSETWVSWIGRWVLDGLSHERPNYFLRFITSPDGMLKSEGLRVSEEPSGALETGANGRRSYFRPGILGSCGDDRDPQEQRAGVSCQSSGELGHDQPKGSKVRTSAQERVWRSRHS